MPPKARVSREMVVEAAFQIARREGADQVNARSVARELGCSTQPVMYHFATMDDLKEALYLRADRFHTDYLLSAGAEEDPLLAMGLNYIRFAQEEPCLFRFLFQSGYGAGMSLEDMIGSPQTAPLIQAMGAGTGLNEEKTRQVFLTVALFAHGYASLVANNAMKLDEGALSHQLTLAFEGAMAAALGPGDPEAPSRNQDSK